MMQRTIAQQPTASKLANNFKAVWGLIKSRRELSMWTLIVRLVAAGSLLLASTVAQAVPNVTGSTISWPDDGWYQVQLINDDGIITWCNGGTSCTVPQGSYIVINHTTGERFEGVQVTAQASVPFPSSPSSPVTSLIAPPINLRLEVYSGSAAELFWEQEGNPFRIETTQILRDGIGIATTNGTSYFDDTRVPGELYRYEVVLLGPADGVSDAAVIDESLLQAYQSIESPEFSILGNTLYLPDDGYYQVQNERTFETVCEGASVCDVSLGTYIVINHTTGARFAASVVGDKEELDTLSDIVVIGNTLSWPDNGWYQVQNATTQESVCEAGRFCTVAEGRYNVINHTTGERTENLSVSVTADISDAIVDRTWLLSAVQDASGKLITVEQQPGFEFSLSLSTSVLLNDGGSYESYTIVEGINVCNHFGGGYSLESNVLNLINVGEDAAACGRVAEPPSRIFQRVLFTRNSPPILSVENNVLTMTSGSNEALIFNLQPEQNEQGPSKLDLLTGDSRWTVSEFQDRSGIAHVIPAEAQWGMALYNNLELEKILSMRFGPCGLFDIAFSLNANTIIKQGMVRVPEATCLAIAPVVLPNLQRQVQSMFNDSPAFSMEFESDNIAVLTAESGEALRIVQLR